MPYPPPAYRVADPSAALQLMRERPFAHLFTAHDGLRATRLPFVADTDEDGRPARLRGHLAGPNPQAQGLDGATVLVTFSGAAAYVSPHWRANKGRGGTYDYEEVQVRGTARAVHDIAFFRQLIDDLSALIEPQHPEIGDYPVWQTSMAPAGYIERLFPLLHAFVIDIASLDMTAKLHQPFPAEDRVSVAEHLSRSHREEPRAIAAKIRKLTDT